MLHFRKFSSLFWNTSPIILNMRVYYTIVSEWRNLNMNVFFSNFSNSKSRVTDILQLHWCYWCVSYLWNTRAPGSGYDLASPHRPRRNPHPHARVKGENITSVGWDSVCKQYSCLNSMCYTRNVCSSTVYEIHMKNKTFSSTWT